MTLPTLAGYCRAGILKHLASRPIQVQKKLAEYQEHEAELRPLAREHAELKVRNESGGPPPPHFPLGYNPLHASLIAACDLKAKLRDAEFTLEQLQAVDQENRGCEEQTSLGRKRVILGAYDM